MNITAMTYNIQSGKNLYKERDIDFSASVIRKIQPDFAVINEVRSHTEDIGPVNQAQELGRLTGYYPVFGRSIDILGGEYGNAFLTRHPLLETEVIPIPNPPEEEREQYFEPRTILRSVIDVKGRRITVLGTHFGLSPAEQRLAVQTATETIRREENPVILMGDLNMTPDDEIIQPLLAALHDTADNRPAPKSFPSGKPEIKIDYIMHTEEIRTISLRSVNTQCSDHRPLIANLAID